MKTKTGVISTIGPATDNEKMLTELMTRGISFARVNMAHNTPEDAAVKFKLIQQVRAKLGADVLCAMDTKGPDVRIGRFIGETVKIEDGQTFKCYVSEKYRDMEKKGTVEGVFVDYPKLESIVKIGAVMCFNDGHVRMEVTDINDGVITSKVLAGGKLKDNKTLAVPGYDLQLPFISKEDEADLKKAAELGLEYIMASEVSNKENVEEMRAFLKANGGANIKIMSKIESQRAFDKLDEIIAASDSIMVARGGLGTDIGLENLVIVQKQIIARTRAAGKPVVCATEMLESMADKANPTRAEASDVANAIWDGATHVMLSSETAAGKYPIECVEFMFKVAKSVEAHPEYNRLK